MQISPVNFVNFKGNSQETDLNPERTAAKKIAYDEYKNTVEETKNNVRPETIILSIAGALAAGFTAIKSVKFARRIAVAGASALTQAMAKPAMTLKNNMAKAGKKLSQEDLSAKIDKFVADISTQKGKLIESHENPKFVEFISNIANDIFGKKGQETAEGIMKKTGVNSLDGVAELGIAAAVGMGTINPLSDAAEGHFDKKSLEEAGLKLMNALNTIDTETPATIEA